MNEMIQQTTKLVEESRKQHFKRIDSSLSNPHNGATTYCYLMNKLLNKVKAPAIPSLIENFTFMQDFTAKADIFNAYFIQQCTTIDTGILVNFDDLPTVLIITKFDISDEKI